VLWQRLQQTDTKYVASDSCNIFQPLAVESLVSVNNSAVTFLDVLHRQIAEILGDVREGSLLFQRLSILIQRFNAVWLYDSFIDKKHGQLNNLY